jgi:putative membrane-bound dehydrogenase-like protein
MKADFKVTSSRNALQFWRVLFMMFPMKAQFRFIAFSMVALFVGSVCAAEPLTLHTRRAGEQNVVQLDPKKTAIVICDMWNQHWCKGATERVAEMAPRMNEVVNKARAQGVFIIHAPSETMKFYEGTPARKRAQAAPHVTPIVALQRWNRIDPAKESPLPIDDSDGGCDDFPQCKGGPPYPWTRQIATIEVKDEDAVTDSEEAYYLLQQRGVDNVIVMGVHANMCVLGRPFSIRQMVAQGKNVLLMRDMTDTMYNSRMRPFVNHFRGTDLIVDHIEKFWCASITSADFIGGEPFRFKGDTGKTAAAAKSDSAKKVVFMIGEPEYDTKTTLPEFAKTELDPLGIQSTFVIADKEAPNDFKGLEALKNADLLFVSVRRATPTKEQMALIRAHLNAGKPLVGIRTASHAFDAKPPDENHVAWTNFDREVLGGNYQNHYGKGPQLEIKATPEGARNPIVAGVDLPFKSTSSLYRSRNLFHTATALLNGQMEGKPEIEPVAWINSGDNRRVFYTSLGAPDDFKLRQFRTLLRNGVLWALNAPIPGAEKKQTAVDQDQPGPLAPEESAKSFKVSDGLEFEQVLAEPIVAQPLQISFDERGRMWVVQYRQYPNPAGLKMVSRDNFWRAVYDKVPQPPPLGVRGLDQITIHEDTDGDGKFDKHKTFVDGLNIATSIALGDGGVYVLNPPYLLFYPDANHDDVPDSPPAVLLAGFGLEDTHSVANSLRWGPDGWLYGCGGSTTTGNIIRPGIDKPDAKPIHFLGQLVWRYQPATKRFEIFAEGGGNAFGLEMDSQGRAFSGHNGGNTRGFYYPQGAFEQKGFEKHGPLSNPYAFGYFKPMGHPDVDRFTHTFIIYEANGLPEQYQGKLFGVEPLQGRVVMSDVLPDGSTFKTRDIGYAVTSSDKWFRPVDIKQGPDGAIYVADWYDRQVNHYRNHEGQVDSSNGRIYRLKAKGAKALPSEDLGKLSNEQLVQQLMSPNKWTRQTALRLLHDRGPKANSAVPLLNAKATSTTGPRAIDFLWALNLVGGLSEPVGRALLSHPEPAVREWVVRLLGDRNEVSPETATALANMAALEPDVHVRSQLASTARRLRAEDDLAIVSRLAEHSEDLNDPHVPLMVWWAVEAKAERSTPEILHWLSEKSIWEKPLVRSAVVERVMRRFAQAGTRQDFLTCAKLFDLSPRDVFTTKLYKGFLDGTKGRPRLTFPDELKNAIRDRGLKDAALAVRIGDPNSIEPALKIMNDPKANREERLRIIEAFGELNGSVWGGELADIAIGSDRELGRAALVALQNYDSLTDAATISDAIPNLDRESQILSLNWLASRSDSSEFLLNLISSKRFNAKDVPQDIVARLRIHAPEKAQTIWGSEKHATTGELQVEIDRVNRVLASGSGSPYEGYKVFSATCGACHKLFGQGGQIGPDLTAFKRDDLQNMLLNIVHPNAEIREGYVNYMVTTKDGRALTGFLADEDKQTVVIRGIDGANMTIARADLESMKPTGFSLMPEGLLQAMEQQQIRDLFAYLRSTQPLVR